MSRRCATDGVSISITRWLAGATVILAMSNALLAEPATDKTAHPPTTAPAAISAADAIKIPPRTGVSTPAASATSSLSNNNFSASRVLMALSVVVGTIFVMRWAARRLLGLPANAGAGGAIHVLSRSTLSPKQQLMLIQVGRRIVLVANCGAQMNPLCEISDPEEIAGLVGQLQKRPAESAAGSFLSLFGRAGKRFDEIEQEPELNIGIEEEDDSPREAGEDHAALKSTQQELGGLLEKVRALSRSTRQA